MGHAGGQRRRFMEVLCYASAKRFALEPPAELEIILAIAVFACQEGSGSHWLGHYYEDRPVILDETTSAQDSGSELHIRDTIIKV